MPDSAKLLRELFRDGPRERIREHVHVTLHRVPRLRFLRVLLALHLPDLLDVMAAGYVVADGAGRCSLLKATRMMLSPTDPRHNQNTAR